MRYVAYLVTNEKTLQLLHPLFEISLFCLGNDKLTIGQLTRAKFTKVCILGVVALCGDCRDISGLLQGYRVSHLVLT